MHGDFFMIVNSLLVLNIRKKNFLLLKTLEDLLNRQSHLKGMKIATIIKYNNLISCRTCPASAKFLEGRRHWQRKSCLCFRKFPCDFPSNRTAVRGKMGSRQPSILTGGHRPKCPQYGHQFVPSPSILAYLWPKPGERKSEPCKPQTDVWGHVWRWSLNRLAVESSNWFIRRLNYILLCNLQKLKTFMQSFVEKQAPLVETKARLSPD